ncbi:S1 RNA binding domain-containing protein [Thermomonospora echinospora]|uniref:S1 RNA binding domain-containing protein n=1 Tax=Thermomonospora echinospora TaxID=1992 RepID=A0A1H5YLQ1_9ACTN|nr:S1 RNA binding domain-containing protein [Thermomonospora echinospora]
MAEDQKAETRPAFLQTLEPGQVRRGTVTSLERFGAFVDLGGASGLVSVPELSWRRFDDVSQVVRVGQDVTVMVLDVDLDRERVSLSLKALQEDPWKQLARTRLGDVVSGPVTKVVPFGVFVAVADGIEGLVHASEFLPGEPPAEGRELTVRIRDINLWRHRMRLALA